MGHCSTVLPSIFIDFPKCFYLLIRTKVDLSCQAYGALFVMTELRRMNVLSPKAKRCQASLLYIIIVKRAASKLNMIHGDSQKIQESTEKHHVSHGFSGNISEKMVPHQESPLSHSIICLQQGRTPL